MSNLKFTVLIACITVLLVGCSRPSPMAGRWRISQTNTYADVARSQNRPGRLILNMVLANEGTYDVFLGRDRIESGKWTFDGTQLTFTPEMMRGMTTMPAPDVAPVKEDKTSFMRRNLLEFVREPE